MTLTITDKIMRSDQTPHTARLGHLEAGDAWQVSWLPHRLMDRNAAITAMTLADLVSEGEGIGLHDDPRWPVVDALAAELGLNGPDAVARISEPGEHGDTPAYEVQAAGTVLRAHADQDARGTRQLGSDDRGKTEPSSVASPAADSTRNAQALARHVKAALLHLRQAEDIAELAGIDLCASEHDVPAAGMFRVAGEAVDDLDLWTINNGRAHGAAPAETYQHTERWCHAPGGALPDTSWPHEPQAPDREAGQ
jgi:hypothetical protein